MGIPRRVTGADSYSFTQYSRLSWQSGAYSQSIGRFRFFSERFSAFLILLLLWVRKNEGMLEVGPALGAGCFNASTPSRIF